MILKYLWLKFKIFVNSIFEIFIQVRYNINFLQLYIECFMVSNPLKDREVCSEGKFIKILMFLQPIIYLCILKYEVYNF